MRKIQSPDLPQILNSLAIDKIEDRSTYELGRLEAFPASIHAEHVRFQEIHLKGVDFDNIQLPSSSWVDVVFENCDLTNLDFRMARFTRVEFIDCKLVGVNCDQANFNDVLFRQCQAPYSLFNLSTFQDVCFDECLLKGANFIDASLEFLDFTNSVIEDVQFTGTSLSNIDLSQCEFSLIHADEHDLRGAIISPEQAIGFIEVFGLKVKDA
ncbi:pentapeptide repeat-containing protein [Bacillus sp. SD088]|uniref:pentapeptide repeat-containing protein n=1 Tax=Bacillus sp. SD088 TaxID=2782012 RepID=UPI001A96475A|nr:pentapeptide repeat-containing protein [Bacillus sp. SD088]MBO0995749.1 pentapeptide repeat-containing protein [Bacillus sp. SD088]